MNMIHDKKIKIKQPFEYETSPTSNATFECKESKKDGNFRYLVMDGPENFVPISTKLDTYDLTKALKVLKELLLAVFQISSMGVNAANLS